MQRIAGSLVLLVAASSGTGAQDAAGLLEQGQALASANRLAEAEVVLTKAAALAGDDSQVLTLLAEVKSRLGENSEAVGLFRRVVVAQQNSAQAHLNLAIALADAGQAKDALREVGETIRLDPRNARAHLNRARVLADMQRPVEARAEFRRAQQLAPSEEEVDYFWGVFEKDNHRPGEAATLLAKVVARKPDQARTWFLLGQAQQLAGREQEAIISWRKAVAIEPSMQEAVYALSQALRPSRPEEAAQLMQQFERLHNLSQNTERVRELGNQAYAAMQEQKWDAAVATLQQALVVCADCPLQADLHQRLGLAECHRGDLENGERELRVALSLNPKDRETLRALQWVAEQKR